MIQDLINLIYPRLCVTCDEVLHKGEEVCCVACKFNLPITDFHKSPQNNPVYQKFEGKVPIINAYSFLHFVKHGQAQKLLHKLKYKGNEEIGEFLGLWYGAIIDEHKIDSFDIVLPIPMHKRKLKKRGYNQADSIAKGISKGLNISWSSEVLAKNADTNSQTKKSRIERWKNINDAFEVKENQNVAGRHVLLVDDVVTTGSTLEACAEVLIAEGAKVSVATIAHAK